MQKVEYELVFLKKTAGLSKKLLKDFVTDILKGFGGLDLLSNILVSCPEGNKVEISVSRECLSLMHSALVMCGSYQGVSCCFRQCSSRPEDCYASVYC